METFGWTEHFCSLPVVPADAGPCLPVSLVALCPGWPGCGCRAGHSQLFCWKGSSLPSLALFLRAVSHIPAASLAGWCSVPQVPGDGRQGSSCVRLGCHAEFGALPQLPRPVCWELEQPSCTCADVTGTRLAAGGFFHWPCHRSSPGVCAQATTSLPCSGLWK